MKCKKVICMVLVLAAVLATTAFATVGSRTAELFYNNIKVMINGKEVTPTDANGNAVEPFIIEGTTYLPVRGVASALGMNVGWCTTTTHTSSSQTSWAYTYPRTRAYSSVHSAAPSMVSGWHTVKASSPSPTRRAATTWLPSTTMPATPPTPTVRLTTSPVSQAPMAAT